MTRFKAGCTCPMMDNHHGRGWATDPHTGEPLHWHDSGCPVHAPRTGTNAPEPPPTRRHIFVVGWLW